MIVNVVINYTEQDRLDALDLASDLKKLGYYSTLIPDYQELKRRRLSQWIIRYLGYGKDCDVLVKMDPDCYVTGKFEIPEKADVFGNLQQFMGGMFPTAGAFGVTSATARRLIGVLNNPVESPYRSYQHQGYDRPIGIEEDLLSMASQRLVLRMTNWPDTDIGFRPYKEIPDGQRKETRPKVIHPVHRPRP